MSSSFCMWFPKRAILHQLGSKHLTLSPIIDWHPEMKTRRSGQGLLLA
jgi:hypothetical protein